MKAGHKKDGTPIDLATAFEAVGKHAEGKMTDEELKEIECEACPSGGSCSGMFTANSMNTLCEAMGVALPGNGTVLAMTPERIEMVKTAAKRIVEIAKMEDSSKYNMKNILNQKAINNAFVIDMAMGGSSIWGPFWQCAVWPIESPTRPPRPPATTSSARSTTPTAFRSSPPTARTTTARITSPRS
jgi:dihydroxyacid dehydratase/phosphogluconate dehydratase